MCHELVLTAESQPGQSHQVQTTASRLRAAAGRHHSELHGDRKQLSQPFFHSASRHCTWYRERSFFSILSEYEEEEFNR